MNPIAGYGATLAMHGTGLLDDVQYAAALAAGRSVNRMRRALARALERESARVRLVTVPGPMGGLVLDALGVDHELAGLGRQPSPGRSTAADTRAAVRDLVASELDCLVFSGGDGTAVDVAAEAGSTPVIGVPAGVKMHSGAFARSPEAAGDLIAAVVAGPVGTERCDLLDDVDGRGLQVTGALWIPAVRSLLQGPKSARSGSQDRAALATLGRELAAARSRSDTWILGPGTTVADVAVGMGLNSTVRGFDVVRPTAPDLVDATEQQLYDAAADGPTNLVLGVIGGQGFLLGRGNHELSARVLDRLEADRVYIVATAAKVAALQPAVLHVDLGDQLPVRSFDGYRRVHVAPGRVVLMRIVSDRDPAAAPVP